MTSLTRSQLTPARSVPALFAWTLVVGLLTIAAPPKAVATEETGTILFGRDNGMAMVGPWVMAPDGSSQTAIDGAVGAEVQVSPDGATLVFDHGNEIWRANADGSNQGPLLENASRPVWSPDGSRLAFIRMRQIWTASADGSGAAQLTAGGGDGDFKPEWSPNGSQIAYSHGENTFSSVRVMNADGSNDRPVDAYPQWSPDGTKVVSTRSGGIWVSNADGSDDTEIAVSASSPVWSPDGTRLAFSRNDRVWVMDADGSNQLRVSSVVERPDTPMRWSPAGNAIYFGRTNYEMASFDLRVVQADGSGEVPVGGIPSGELNFSPAGDKVAFALAEGIWVANADGSNRTLVIEQATSVRWSPSGTRLAFQRGGGVWVASADGSDEIQLTDNGYLAQWIAPAAPDPEAPAAPTITEVTPGDGQVTVAFEPGDDGGSAITGYTATCGTGDSEKSATGDAAPITVSGLSNGIDVACTVRATNAAGDSPESTPSAQVSPVGTIRVTTSSLSDGQIGKWYSATFRSAGGSAPFKWTLASGALPAGLKLNTFGTLSGNPTTAGSATFTVRVADGKGNVDHRRLTLLIKPIVIATTSLPAGRVGAWYSTTLKAAGGIAPFKWTVAEGSLPTGLKLAQGGFMWGTPTVPGSSAITVKVTDAKGNTASRAYTLTINPRS